MVKVSTDAVTNVNDEDDVAPPPALPIGHVIGGKYVIKSVLGAGGNGAVYEGEHVAVGHRVAIKVVHPTLAARKDVIARFQREARICGSLDHPNVGKVYDVGTLDDGAPYMVMELQEGRSLADVIDETRIPIPAILHIAQQLLDGLGAAHQAGSMHRDVKPDNVMIVRDRSGEVIVKLVDFGISKTLGDTHNHSVTGQGLIIGSPDYMSPEQLRGEDVDARTDIYSTGVLLYEAITSRRPFEQDKLVDLVTSVMRDPVVPPSQLRTDCPAQLEAVVLKAMARDPGQRYATTDEMARALQGVHSTGRGNTHVSLAALSQRPVARRGGKPHLPRSLASAWLIAAIVAVAITGTVAVLMIRAEPQGSPAITTTPLIEQSAQPLAPRVDTASAARVASAQPVPLVTEPIVVDMGVLNEPAQRPESESRPRRRNEPRVKSAPVEAPAPAVPAIDVDASLKEAAKAFALGQADRARALYQDIVRASPGRAEAWRGLGLAANRLGQRAEAERAFNRYLALRPNAPDAARIREQLERAP